jgi:hypothetical protein
MLPKADLAGSLELSRQFSGTPAALRANRELSIGNALIPGGNGGPDVPIRIQR